MSSGIPPPGLNQPSLLHSPCRLSLLFTMSLINDTNGFSQATGAVHKTDSVQQSAVLHRHLHHDFLNVTRGEGHYLVLEDGRKLFDSSGGAAVACIGVSDLILADMASNSEALSAFLATPSLQDHLLI